MESNHYFSRAWKLLTRDRGWIKPLLVMTCASLVPIAGPLGNKGYALEWARLTAWGVDAAPKQKNVDVGRCIASGWRGFVIDLGWIIALIFCSMMLSGIVAVIPGVVGAIVSLLVSIAISLASTLWGTFLQILEIRGAIYERIGAGYRADRAMEMVRRDVRGFMRLFLIQLVCGVIMGTVSGIIALIVMIEMLPTIIAAEAAGAGTEAILGALAGSIVFVVLTCAILGMVVTFLTCGIRLVTLTAAGLWMRQFDVPSWGRSEDPLPSPADEDPTSHHPQITQPEASRTPAPDDSPAASTSVVVVERAQRASQESSQDLLSEARSQAMLAEVAELGPDGLEISELDEELARIKAENDADEGSMC